jgi:hypothetical protein
MFLVAATGAFAQVATQNKLDSFANAKTTEYHVFYKNLNWQGTARQSIMDSLTDAENLAMIVFYSKFTYFDPATTIVYKTSAPVNLNNVNGKTINNLSIDLGGKNLVGIRLFNCSNIRITKCRVVNNLGNYGIQLYNCTNITIDSCFVSNVGAGIYCQQSKSVKVNFNQCLNINGSPDPKSITFGHAIQFDNVCGSGCQMNYNRVENIAGIAQKPHDILSIYQSNGLPGDSIQCIGNWIRGGQIILPPGGSYGACGIGCGDAGGSYQVIRSNIVVSSGMVGIQAQGGTHITVDHNIIVSDAIGCSLVGLSFGNYSGKAVSDIKYAYNKVKWYTAGNKTEFDYWIDPAAKFTPAGLATNTWSANISPATALPITIITMK